MLEMPAPSELAIAQIY